MLQTLNLVTKTLLIITFSIYAGSCFAQQMPALPQSQLVLPVEDHEIKFKWLGDSVNATWESHAALLIPITLPGCPKLFFMQFDTGSPSSLFYKGKLKAIQRKYPQTIQMEDTGAAVLKNYNFKAGDMSILAKEISVRKKGNESINWTDKKSIEIIGTIGTDLLENKVIVIDYPRQKILIAADIPAKINARVELSDFMFMRRSILLPAIIRGKKSTIFFDSGSSAYELLTDKTTAQSLSTSDTVHTTYSSKGWDRTLTANTFLTNDSIELASQKIPLKRATYMEGVDAAMVNQMMKLGMGGMTGNKLFINHILVLDTKNKKFGLISSR